ncbi:DMT family transporter [Myxococcota bacterium]|nr:DMT family transporter [Myxococcota bacterium]
MVLVFIGGALQPIQAGMNAEMERHLGDRFQAGFINGFMNVVVIGMTLIVLWRGWPSWTALQDAPLWAFWAGAIGALIVLVQLSAAPVLGAGILIAFFVAGQVCGSLVVDAYGLVGYAVRGPSGLRLIALALVMSGVALAAASTRFQGLD